MFFEASGRVARGFGGGGGDGGGVGESGDNSTGMGSSTGFTADSSERSGRPLAPGALAAFGGSGRSGRPPTPGAFGSGGRAKPPLAVAVPASVTRAPASACQAKVGRAKWRMTPGHKRYLGTGMIGYHLRYDRFPPSADDQRVGA